MPRTEKMQKDGLTLVDAINEGLEQEMRRDDRVVLLGEDIGRNGGVFRVTEGLQKQFGADRVIDTPLSESGIIGTSIGMAMAGQRPVPEIQFDGFLGPAYDQLVNHAARFRNRTRGRLTVPMTVRVPWGGGIHAPEFHSDSPEAIYIHSPGMKVVCASTPSDAKGLLLSAIRDPDPVIFFEPKRVYRSFREQVDEGEYTIPIGKAKIVTEGTDVTIVTWGANVFQCLEALDQLPDDLSVELIDLRTLHPMDTDAIFESVDKTGRLVVVQEAPRLCSLGSEIASQVMERCFLRLQAPVQRVAGFDTIMPYAKLELDYLPSPRIIAEAVQQVAAY